MGVVSLHGLASGALVYTDLSVAVSAAMGVMLLGSLLWQWYRYGSMTSPGFITRLSVCPDGRWQLVYADGTVRQWVIKRYYIHARLLILQFQGEFPGLGSTLVIPADAADPELLRRLRCYLLRLAWHPEA